MVYYINYIDLKDNHKGLELIADSIEDLFNQLIHRKDIATIDEIVELEEASVHFTNAELRDEDFEDWISRNRI